MRERARLLKGGFEDIHWLSSLEESMARRGVAIAAARRDLVARLNRAVAAGVGPFPAVALALDCGIDSRLGTMAALAVEDDLRPQPGGMPSPGRGDRWRRSGPASRRFDRDTPRQGLAGAALFDRRAKGALDRAGSVPCSADDPGGRCCPGAVALDELAAHFDDARRAALFDEILALGAQAWITGTDAGIFASLGGRAQHFEVGEGRITPAAARAKGVQARSGALDGGPTDEEGIQ